MSTENTLPEDQISKLLTFSMNASTYIPKFVEGTNTGNKFVFFGKDNKFPNTLCSLIQEGTVHGALFQSFVQQVKGSGLRIKDNKKDVKLQAYIDQCNSKGENLYQVAEKIIYDFVLYGGFSTSNIWTKGKQKFEIYHTDFETLRSGICDVTGTVNDYYYSSDWTKGTQSKYERYSAFNVEKKNGTQINYYVPYASGLKYYPLPRYQAAIGWAMLEHKIMEFHNANVDNSFCPSLFISYHNGVPNPERAKQIVEELIENFSNQNGGAGKFMINFSPTKEQAATVTVLNNNDNDQKYSDLMKTVQTEILAGWRVTSPELMSIKIQGELSSTDLVQSQELLFSLVIQPMQIAVEKELNRLLKIQGYQNEIEIISVQPISFSLSESAMLQCMTVNEIRDKAGLEPLPNGDYIPSTGKQIEENSIGYAPTGEPEDSTPDETNPDESQTGN
jgi:hypothetical protein